jgi:DNA-binding HxlR family transcriptional regulator
MRYAAGMTRTHKSVGYSPKSKPAVVSKSRDCSPEAAAEAFELLEGRWKLVIIHNLFGVKEPHRPLCASRSWSGLFRNVSQKMLIQQLRCLERDGIVQRTIHPQVPPKVEYQLTSTGEASVQRCAHFLIGRTSGKRAVWISPQKRATLP